MNPAIPPRKLVEETLRRLCIESLNNDIDFQRFQYLDAWEQLQCYTTKNLTACANQALQQITETDRDMVDECILLSGEMGSDVMNMELQLEVDRQEQESLTLSDVPMLHIQGRPFMGPWTVESIFHAVCTAFLSSSQQPQQTPKRLPIACEFCIACHDVRHCLWYLECDGKPFDSLNFRDRGYAGSHGDNTTSMSSMTPPPPITTPPITPPPNTWFSNTDNLNFSHAPNSTTATTTNTNTIVQPIPVVTNSSDTSETREENDTTTTGYFLGGILVGFVVGVLPAFCFGQRERRTRRQITAALATREQQYWENTMMDVSYKDELALSSGTKARPSQEELRNLDDIILDEFGAPQQWQQGKQQLKKEPPRMAFGLHKVI
jgi:hypothetical protein